jgi:two-component system nitrate/nitrite response regulator NarL
MLTSWPEMMRRGTKSLLFEDPIGLSIVSDSQLLCEGLAALLSQYLPRCTVTVYTGLEIPEWLPRRPHQLALIDASTGIEKTVRLIRAWHAAHPTAAVLTLELADNASEIMACIEAGAMGYILRGVGIDTVVEALLLLRSGQAVCSLEIAAQVFARLAELGDNRQESAPVGVELTEREREVLTYLAADWSNQEIAERLVIEVRTVKHHVHNILAKLKARHRWQAVIAARDQGLISK